MANYTRSYSLLTVGSSTVTSAVVFIGDAATISVSLQTVGASVVSIDGSSAEGFKEAIPENTWSNMTVLIANGIFAVQPGARWLRARQAASSSSASVQLAFSVR